MAAPIKRVRTDGRASGWWVRYRDQQGRQHSSPTFRTKKEAQAFADDLTVARRNGTEPAIVGRSSTFEQLCREWLAHKPTKAATTLARDETVLTKHFHPALGRLQVGEVDVCHVQRAVAAMSHLAPRTVRTNYGVLRAVFSWAVKNDWIERSPCRNVPMPKVPKREKRLADADDLHRLAAALPAQYRPAVYLGALGLRQAEVFGLRVGAVNFFARTLTVRETVNVVGRQVVHGGGKNDSSVRTISVPQSVIDMLAEHLARTGRHDPDAFVIQADEGGPVRADNFRHRAYNPALRATRLEGLTFHRLRHSAGHMMREAGVPLEVISRRLGHASIRTTADVYGSLPASVDRAVADQLDGLLGSPRDPRVIPGEAGEAL